MSFEAVRQTLVDRLEEGDRGDRGWFIITRVHVALGWLKGIAEYLEHRGGGGTIHLTDKDYLRLSTIIETGVTNPGVQLRRHHLLVMDKPLQLLQRTNNHSWSEISLTERGRELAYTNDPAKVLERSLDAIRFAVQPWSPSDRADQYNNFNVPVYDVTKQVLGECNGYIDRNEFDFFLSRIRVQDEVGWAIDVIDEYRKLSTAEQQRLHVEVRDRIPSEKKYQNWRDISLHTFSLFSLGTSMVREGQRLLQTKNWVGAYTTSPSQEKPTPQLRLPDLPEIENLLTPPAAPASNDGADAESFVAKILRSQGWEVAFYTNRRGYGFDLWARKDNKAMVIEVKSSLTTLGTVSLTSIEYQAAQEYSDNFILALVENLGSDTPKLWLVQNPIKDLAIEERTITSFTITRAEWTRGTNQNT